MTTEERVRALHDKAVQELVSAHNRRKDEPLVLAVRYNTSDPMDVYLLEVLHGFPGAHDDELNNTPPKQNHRLDGYLPELLNKGRAILRFQHQYKALSDLFKPTTKGIISLSCWMSGSYRLCRDRRAELDASAA